MPQAMGELPGTHCAQGIDIGTCTHSRLRSRLAIQPCKQRKAALISTASADGEDRDSCMLRATL